MYYDLENLFKLNDMERKKDCESCINFDESDCVCAKDCIGFDQWYIDEGIVERERIEAIEIIKEIYDKTDGWFDSIQLGENLHNRMKRIIAVNA